MKPKLTTSLSRLAFAAACLTCLNAPAQSWQTVVNFQTAPGMTARAEDIGTDATGSMLYSAGSANVDGVNTAMLRGSADGGQTWTVLDAFAPPEWPYAHYRAFGSAPNGALFTAGLLTDLLGNDSTLAWIVRRSIDGGSTWTTQDLFEDVVIGKPSCADIKATASGEIYAAGVTAGQNGATGWFWLVRKSADGGDTWTTVDQFSGDGFLQGRAIEIHPAGSVFVVGDGGDNQSGYHGYPRWTVRRTQNGGATWSTVDLLQTEKQLTSQAYGIAVDNAGAVYVCGRATIAVKGKNVEYWIVRRSVDGGATWATVDKYNLSDNSPLTGTAIAFTSSAIYVCGFTGPENGSTPNGWLVRKGTPGAKGSISWAVSDNFQMVAGQSARANGITTDAAGNVFVSGRAADETGTSHFITRKLTP